jgi:CubicO group peptidase (beta-lactamase class C family)
MSNTPARRSSGFVAPGFEPLRDELDLCLLRDVGYAAQLCVYLGDRLVVDLVGGPDLEADSVTGVFSASKGAAALTLATLVESAQLDLGERVAHYWPEFAAEGKDRVTVEELLSHRAGIPGVDGGFSLDEFLDSSAAAARLAKQRPFWRPGSAFGYHALVLGVLMEELVRRVAGTTLQELYERVVRGPREIGFYLGLPLSEESRYREVRPATLTSAQQAESEVWATNDDTLRAVAFNHAGRGFEGGAALSPNQRSVRAAGPSGFGGTASARGLAGLYAAALGNLGDPLVSAATLGRFTQELAWGHDRILDSTMCYGAVFQKPMPRMDFGSYQAFGHDGGGGALGFADPFYDLAFGYVPLPMQYSGGARYPGGFNPTPVRLSEIARACVADRS